MIQARLRLCRLIASQDSAHIAGNAETTYTHQHHVPESEDLSTPSAFLARSASAAAIDAGIRLGEFIASDMVAVRLTPSFRLIVATSPSYLARAGRPRTPSDFAAHACVRMRHSSGALANRRLQNNGAPLDVVVSGPLIFHDYSSMLDAALAGAALVQVPEPIAREHFAAGRLDEVLGKSSVVICLRLSFRSQGPLPARNCAHAAIDRVCDRIEAR